ATKREQQKYNGWKNYETWNIALWMQNDETLYREAVAFVKHLSGEYASDTQRRHPYSAFIKAYGVQNHKTGDGVRYDNRKADRAELDAMLRELVECQAE
ncbi:MAG: hypothetical protein WCX88_02555, partial [Patescibacteria group bacterium]